MGRIWDLTQTPDNPSKTVYLGVQILFLNVRFLSRTHRTPTVLFQGTRLTEFNRLKKDVKTSGLQVLTTQPTQPRKASDFLLGKVRRRSKSPTAVGTTRTTDVVGVETETEVHRRGDTDTGEGKNIPTVSDLNSR